MWLLLVALLVLAGCGGGGAAPTSPVAAAPTPPPRPIAVIVSVDGLRPDAISNAEALNIQSLAARGSYSWQAQTTMPSNTLPSHVSMLTGYSPTAHKVTWDEYQPSRGKLTVPTLFAAAKASGLRTTMVVGKDKFQLFQDTGSVDVFVTTLRGDDDVANQAIVQIHAGIDLMFVHFPDVDLSGHAQKWMSETYLARVGTVDKAIGRILSALPSHATVVLTADHGGRDNNHGTSNALETTIPWIIAGPKIQAGREIAAKISTTDTAATVAKILGLSLAGDVQGRAVGEVFVP